MFRHIQVDLPLLAFQLEAAALTCQFGAAGLCQRTSGSIWHLNKKLGNVDVDDLPKGKESTAPKSKKERQSLLPT